MKKELRQIRGPLAANSEICENFTISKLGIQAKESHLFQVNKSFQIQIGKTNLYESPDGLIITSLWPLQDEDETMIIDFIKEGD